MSKHKVSQGRFLPTTMLALLVAALSLSLLACGGGSDQKGTLRVAIERIGLPQFTPSTVTWPNESNRWGYGATETLLGSDAEGKSINRLAKSWEVKDDGIHITLQEGVEFHKDHGRIYVRRRSLQLCGVDERRKPLRRPAIPDNDVRTLAGGG